MEETSYLITGGYGFIGFNFISWLLKNNLQPRNIINVDNITYAAEYMLKEKKKFLKQYKCHKHFKYNICDTNKIEKLIRKYNVTHIINFAAESHVDNSIKNPGIFIETNIKGTQSLLDLTKKYNLRYHQVSTDEVYGSVDPVKDVVNENFKLNPSSPYSASKLSADLLVQAYVKTFGINATISRCTNNYGPWQHNEKLIPKVITNCFHFINIPVYGDGKQMRNWIYVDDHCEAIYKIINKNDIAGEIFNVGSDTLITNIDLILMILKITSRSEILIKFVDDRPGHDFCYHLCSDKIKQMFDWKEQTNFESGLNKTIEFYKDYFFEGKLKC